MKTLLAFRKNIYSQNGEDGVLAELFSRLQIRSGWFCEFGAWDGKHLSNSYLLLEGGWSGVMIEGDEARFKDLERTADEHSEHLFPIRAFVSPETKGSTLDSLLAKTPIPRNFELLSIDIDSEDWQIWRSMKEYNPQVVVIEINSSLVPGVEQIHGQDGKTGSSFTSTLRLGQEKGYTLVCHTGNMIFVRNDLISKINLPTEEINNPNGLFVSDWVNERSVFNRFRRRLKRLFL